MAGAGDDFINAQSGDDYIDGGLGADVMVGGNGNDTYVVDNLGDTISENGGGNDTVITSLSTYVLSNDLENLKNSGSSGFFTGLGTASANVLVGNDFVDNLYGAAGNDLLIGNKGADVLYGGGGNDEIYGGNGADYIHGGAGIDKIVGGIGNDTMTGGTGNDMFCFAAGFGNDRITDFDAGPPGGQDLLDLKQFGITAANFDSHVAITDVGADTLITIDHAANQTIRLVGIGNSTLIDKTDFALLGA